MKKQDDEKKVIQENINFKNKDYRFLCFSLIFIIIIILLTTFLFVHNYNKTVNNDNKQGTDNTNNKSELIQNNEKEDTIYDKYSYDHNLGLKSIETSTTKQYEVYNTKTNELVYKTDIFKTSDKVYVEDIKVKFVANFLIIYYESNGHGPDTNFMIYDTNGKSITDYDGFDFISDGSDSSQIVIKIKDGKDYKFVLHSNDSNVLYTSEKYDDIHFANLNNKTYVLVLDDEKVKILDLNEEIIADVLNVNNNHDIYSFRAYDNKFFTIIHDSTIKKEDCLSDKECLQNYDELSEPFCVREFIIDSTTKEIKSDVDCLVNP